MQPFPCGEALICEEAVCVSELFHISPLWQALAASLMTWGVTALGAGMVLAARRPRPLWLDAMLGFGAGVMLASSFWSLLAPAISRSEALGQTAWLICGIGFLVGGGLMLLCDALLRHLQPENPRQRRSHLLMWSITLHNIPEGLAVGVAFGAAARGDTAALAAAWMLAIGIALQNFPEGAAVSLPLRREGYSVGRALWMGQLSGMVEPVAAVAGALLCLYVSAVLPFLLALAAGAMVAVVIAELVPESQRSSHAPLMTLATLVGFAVMMALDVTLG
ncbi:MAG: ZIP family metal transporter [Clostridiales bacterium]|nr:ZIP family metal transporter [Clostridiales bacterium]